MPTRSEIQSILAASQEKIAAYFAGLSPADLERPCTASGVPGEAPWRAKDHFAHLTPNEQNIQMLLRLTLTGQPLPDNMASMTAEERGVWANQRNQTYVNAHRDNSMDALRANLAAARQETLDLLDQLTDEQLSSPIQLPFIPNMTVGDLLAANAHHAAMHVTWIEEGLHQNS